MSALLKPRSIVVIGASRDPESIGEPVLRHVIDSGFTGRVHAVNPAASELQGCGVTPSARWPALWTRLW